MHVSCSPVSVWGRNGDRDRLLKIDSSAQVRILGRNLFRQASSQGRSPIRSHDPHCVG